MATKFERLKRDFFEDIIAFSTLCDQPQKLMKKYTHHKINPSNFKRMEPMLEDYWDASKSLGDNRLILNPNDNELTLSIIGAPLDFCHIRYPDGDDKKKNKYQVLRVWKVTDYSTVRGKVPKFFPELHGFSNTFFTHDGGYHNTNFYAIPINDGLEWKVLAEPGEYIETGRVFKPNGGKLEGDDGKDHRIIFRGAMAFSLTNRYEWSVELGYQNYGPTINLVVPPRAILSLFKFRDVPDGKKRRASLKHWVDEHWRQAPEKDESTYVRKHLRGSLDFTMGEMRFSVHPSEYDLEHNEWLREQRKLLYH